MLLFSAKYPDATIERDGMMQRILAIDNYFSAYDRVYLHVAFLDNWKIRRKTPSTHVTVYELNFFLHLLFIIFLGCKAKGVYIHSVHNGLRSLPLYLHGNVFTDLHGLFPEEQACYGKRFAAILYGWIERIAIRRSRGIIVVSDAMKEYLRGKYGVIGSRVYTVPIFDDLPIAARGEGGGPVVALYSGGSQKWQNVDMMMEAMARMRDRCPFVVLTADLACFERKIAEYGLGECVKALTVAKSEVHGYYLEADLGFVLRDGSALNRAACPTKLVEYMACGLVPIVLEPEIGDFAARGYACLSLERFAKGDLPSREELEAMRQTNYRVIASMRDSAAEAMENVVADFTGKGN